MEQFKIDQLLSNFDLIKEHCLRKEQCEANEHLAADCDELRKSAQTINKMANEFIYFDALQENGFFVFLAILTAYTDVMVRQLKTEKQIKTDLIEMLKAMLLYRNFLMDLYEELKSEESSFGKSEVTNETSRPRLMQRAYRMRSKHAYKQLK